MKDCWVTNQERARWIKEQSNLEHENTEPLGSAATTGWPYTVEDKDQPYGMQVGAKHYLGMAIQPHEYIVKNKIGWSAGNAIKYLSRYKSKGGAEDVKKAIHYCQLLLKEEYGI